ncbi:MAG: type VI secretion system Vgr family protein [Alcanivorax nanhaiticus]
MKPDDIFESALSKLTGKAGQMDSPLSNLGGVSGGMDTQGGLGALAKSIADGGSLSEQLLTGLGEAAGISMNTLVEAPKCRFFIDVAGLGEEALAVECFASSDLGLSSLGRMQVDVLARINPALASMPGEPATLRVEGAGAQQQHFGFMVEAVEELGASPEGPRLRLHLVSPLYPLVLNRHNRVFLNKTVQEIISQVMEEAGFNADTITIELKQSLPTRAMTVQYEESDLAFLTRLLARDGIFYTAAHQERGAHLYFLDDSNRLQDILGSAMLEYHPRSGQPSDSECVFQLTRTLHWRSGTFNLHDHNPDTPDADPKGYAEGLGGRGDQHFWGVNAVDADQCSTLARIRCEVEDVQRQTVIARADTGQFIPGMKLILSGHPQHDGEWLVAAVNILGDQRVGHAFGQNSDQPGLQSELTLVPVSIPWRSAAQWRRSPVHGTFSALVEGDGSEYAYLDDQGRYRIRFPFDLSDTPKGEASPPVRLMQPYGGPDSGLHLPLHAGTEVMLSCVNGDIDRPVILGALSNPVTPGPVSASNPSQHILRTRGGNELLMEDRAGEESIELFTRDRQNRLSLDARADAQQVTLESIDGDMTIRAGSNMTTEVGGSQTWQVGEDQTITVTRDLKLMTQEGEVELQAGSDLLFKAGDNLRMATNNGNLNVHAGKDLILKTENSFSLDVVSGDASMVVNSGKLGMDVQGAITLRGSGSAPIRLSQGGGSIEITPGGDLIIDASNVEISGGSIKVDGQMVGSN